jgi:hypothetical protein
MGMPKLQKCKFEELWYPESTLLFAVVVIVSEACVVTAHCQKTFATNIQNYCHVLVLYICSSNLHLGTTDGMSFILSHTKVLFLLICCIN